MNFVFKNLKIYFLCPLFIFLGSIITLSIVQVEDNCIVEKLVEENKKYYRTNDFNNPTLVILVISAPKNLDRRNVVRETWLSQNVNQKKNNVMHYFVVGSVGLSADAMLHLSAEQSKYNDLLILPIEDSYSKLTYKVLQSYVWINEQINFGLSFSYLLKCDDDSFVRLDLLKKEMKAMQMRQAKNDFEDVDENVQNINIQTNLNNKRHLKVYWGYFNGNARIKMQGKWKETNWILCNNYIPYAQGGGYIISQGIVTYLAKNFEDLNLYNSEDVSVGTWLAPVSNIVRIHDTRFDTEWNSRGCLNAHIIFHKITMDEMRRMHANIKEKGKPCIQETMKRKQYYYDWTVIPSKCCSRV